MRFKFLSAIASFLFLCIAFTACMETEEYVYSSDASVYAFGIDTIHGKHYKFSIDQVNRRIFNRDSLPMGADTILDKIIVDTFTVSGNIRTGELDTLFTVGDTVNLTAAINNPDGMKFKISAPDAFTTRTYFLTINVHKQDPDTLVWNAKGNIKPSTYADDYKAVLLGDKAILLTANGLMAAYPLAATDNQQIEMEAISNFPEDADVSSLIAFGDKLYMRTASNKLYTSTDAKAWTHATGSAENVVALLAVLPQSIAAIREVDGKKIFSTSADGINWVDGEEVPQDFPTGSYQYTPMKTANGVDEVMLVGAGETEDRTIPWFTIDGSKWGNMNTTSGYYCPQLDNPCILYYGEEFYAFGSKLDRFYTSEVGIAWAEVKKKFLFPAEFAERGAYSMVVDTENFIWMFLPDAEKTSYEVWRGRLNRLGFER